MVACIAVYFPVSGNDFLYFWDDQWVVMNRYTEGGLYWQNLWATLTEFYHGQYAPFNELLYMLLYAAFGYNPLPFHLASLLLHIVNVCFAYYLLRNLVGISTKIKTDSGNLIAFLAALIFAVHSFNVESVAWMSASKILVYSFWYLLASLSFVAYLKHGKLRYYIYTLALFIFSFLGKEQAVTFPLWMLLIYWCAGYGFKNRKVWLTVTPFFVLSLVFGIITMLSQSDGNTIISTDQTYPVWQRIVYACYTFIEYLLKTVFPYKLSYLYPFPSAIGDPLPQWLLFYPSLLIVALIASWKFITSQKAMAFGLLFFGIHIAVALHLVSLSRFAVVADRYAYIASIGACFVLAFYSVKFFRQCEGYKKWGLALALIAYILYLGVYANVRSRVWHDTDSLKKELRELLKERNDYEENRGKGQNVSYNSKSEIVKMGSLKELKEDDWACYHDVK
jgi:hypothetical protein